jgi:hypothetical protein
MCDLKEILSKIPGYEGYGQESLKPDGESELPKNHNQESFIGLELHPMLSR